MEKIALLPGGFKPPHAGHYNMAKWLVANTDADTVIIRVGSKERGGVTREMSLKLWDLYRESDPDSPPLSILASENNSPVADIYDFIEQEAPEGSKIYLGAGEKDKEDSRYNNIGKFADPKDIDFEVILVPPQSGGVSGTAMRELIKDGDKNIFQKYLPDHLTSEQKEKAWKIVTTKQEVEEDFRDFAKSSEWKAGMPDGHKEDIPRSYKYHRSGVYGPMYEKIEMPNKITIKFEESREHSNNPQGGEQFITLDYFQYHSKYKKEKVRMDVDWGAESDEDIRAIGGDVYYGDESNKTPDESSETIDWGQKTDSEIRKIGGDVYYGSDINQKLKVKGKQRMLVAPDGGWPGKVKQRMLVAPEEGWPEYDSTEDSIEGDIYEGILKETNNETLQSSTGQTVFVGGLIDGDNRIEEGKLFYISNNEDSQSKNVMALYISGMPKELHHGKGGDKKSKRKRKSWSPFTDYTAVAGGGKGSAYDITSDPTITSDPITKYIDKKLGVQEQKGGKILRVYDFDDTLAITKGANIKVKHKDNSIDILNPAEFAVYDEQEGDKFDFTEFDREIKKAEPIQNIISMLRKDLETTAKVTILTARLMAYPVRRYLRTEHDLDAYVVAVGSSDPQDKANWIKNHIEKGYKDILFIDDSEKNRNAVASLKDEYPDIKLDVKDPDNLNEQYGDYELPSDTPYEDYEDLGHYTTSALIINDLTIPLEVMRNFEDKIIGMGGREEMKAGMLFPYDDVSNQKFHMEGCKIPLDIVFINKGTIDTIHDNCPPCKKLPCKKYSGLADNVLELPGGYCKKNNINVGDKANLNLTEGKLLNEQNPTGSIETWYGCSVCPENTTMFTGADISGLYGCGPVVEYELNSSLITPPSEYQLGPNDDNVVINSDNYSGEWPLDMDWWALTNSPDNINTEIMVDYVSSWGVSLNCASGSAYIPDEEEDICTNFENSIPSGISISEFCTKCGTNSWINSGYEQYCGCCPEGQPDPEGMALPDKNKSPLKDKSKKEPPALTKEWWEYQIKNILTEGGAAGHMAHPFNLPDINSGSDLKDIFNKAAASLKNNPGSVKIDGVNSSIRLIDIDGEKQFVMDRGSKKELDIKGITKNDLEDRFKPGHGMIKIGGEVLDMFNEALPSLQGDLEKLGAWDNPNILFNMEYVSGKTNVQDYGSNFIAIHGLNQIESKEVQGKRKMLTKRISSEISYSKDDLQSLLDSLAPIAEKKGFEVYGSVPTEMTKEPNFSSALSQNYTIVSNEGEKTQTLDAWLNELNNIPEEDFIFMNVDNSKKKVGAVSKQVYTTLLNGSNIDELFESEEDKQKAIEGFTTYLATEKLGDEVLKVLDSPMGTVDNHEGVVIRDEKLAKTPFKITGKFILGGLSSDF